MKKIEIPKELVPYIKAIQDINGTPILVGGYVRDQLLGISSTDIDIEVFDIENYQILEDCLSSLGPVNPIGKSFGILQVIADPYTIEFALPRTENKTGKGHTGFDVQHHPKLSFEDASARRDFTINAIGYNLNQNKILDPHHGIDDLDSKCLKHVSDAFSEDSLRVYRAMQFAARFELSIHPETIKLCQSIPLDDLPKERIFEEFKKLLLKAKKPSIGFNLMDSLGILKYLPELKALQEVPQDPQWHPEGDVWTHTMMVVDCMAKLMPKDPEKGLVFMFAALCHDFGKPSTTKFIEERWRSRGHEKEGIEPSKNFLNRLTDHKQLVDTVIPLVKHHMKPALLYKAEEKDNVTDAAIRRLSTKVNITALVLLAKADHFGRTTENAINKQFPAGDWLLARAQQLDVKDSQPKPFVTGQDLIDLGMTADKKLGDILKMLYEKQLNGEIKNKEEGLHLL